MGTAYDSDNDGKPDALGVIQAVPAILSTVQRDLIEIAKAATGIVTAIGIVIALLHGVPVAAPAVAIPTTGPVPIPALPDAPVAAPTDTDAPTHAAADTDAPKAAVGGS